MVKITLQLLRIVWERMPLTCQTVPTEKKNAQTPVIQISKSKNNTALIHLFLGRYLSSIILLPHPYPHAEPGGNKIFIPPVTAKC